MSRLRRPGCQTALVGFVLLALVCSWSPPAAALGLYEAVAVVTGQGEKNRQLGFALALETVLVKVAGDPRLIGDARVAALHPSDLVEGYRYRDRLEGIPIHDEQGSYDRPHDLTVSFVPGKIDAALLALGSKPWVATRPRLAVFFGVTTRSGKSFVLMRDGERDADMRYALNAAAIQVGFTALLPDEMALDAAALGVETLPEEDPAALAVAAQAIGGDLALVGNLVWSDAALGWVAEWRIAANGRTVEWQIRGVSFDDAFRNGIRGAAQVLSGNGRPK